MNEKQDEVLVLHDGRGTLYVPLPLYRRFRDAILIVIPAMIPEVGYKTEHLLGTDIWETLDAGGRRFAGRCISHMERRGEIPLRRVTPRYKYPVRYAR
jgi:hypothetical protein